ncbi:DUF6541 family protein [Microbacterium aurantiacum]|uniref:DUF6541 family protein n=1 Tax=Microbacterium aurantiacum TaxID=162393 RepID=UPI003D74BE5B
MSEWAGTAAGIAFVAFVLLVPGLAVAMSGWRWTIRLVLIAPALSLTIIALAATVAPIIGLEWSLLPVAGLTTVFAGVAFSLRRLLNPRPFTGDATRLWLVVSASLAFSAVALTIQQMIAYGGPENISQTFDAIVHLNSVAQAVETGSASPFDIATRAGSAFYPNAWASLASLVAVATGASVAASANVATIGVVSMVWPASSLLLAWTLFRARRSAIVATGILSAAFGAFPWVMLYFGVLYPNLVGFAMIPAVVGETLRVARDVRGWALVPSTAVVGLLAVGLGLGHPNALVAAAYILCAVILYSAVGFGWRYRSPRGWLLASTAVGLVVVFVILVRRYVGTSEGASGWLPWQSPAQAFGEAFLAHPNALGLTLVIAVLMGAGIVTGLVHTRYRLVLLPFVVASFLFVLASGYPVGTRLRDFFTNPFYNDSFRLAALLGVVAVPVAVAGALCIADFVRRRLEGAPPWAGTAWTIAATLVLCSTVWGAGVRDAVERVGESYASSPSSPLLSADERVLVERLSEVVPDGAIIAGSPRTGASLAYALAEREVLDFHIFGPRSDAAEFVNQNLDSIDTDPRVCEAVRATGVQFVLDFGADGVGNSNVTDWDGLIDLEPSNRLQIVDREGDAVLFAIVGC